MIAVRLGVVCLHVHGFSQSRGQSQSNRIMSFFASFVSSHVFIYEYEFSKTAYILLLRWQKSAKWLQLR